MKAEHPGGRLVAIVGPTAAGKSDLALRAAQRLEGEIISCDSVSVYRGLDIGSGKPTPADQAQAPHHLVDILDLHEGMNAGIFAERASEAIQEIARRGRLPIVTGGTGLYLTALLKGLFEAGGSDPKVRARLDRLAQRRGPVRLHRLLTLLDPVYAKKTQVSDQVRVVRALEVRFVLGRPFSTVQQERKPAFRGATLVIGLDPGREELRRRVRARVLRMLQAGLVAETQRALGVASSSNGIPRALGAIGYREVVARLREGAVPASGDEELLRVIVNSTMQYAKRQMTYFRGQFRVEWFAQPELALARIEEWAHEGQSARPAPEGEPGSR